MRVMLNPVHLRTLVAVIRTGSFADAARELGYTSSAVSQQVAALERSTRLVLFDRSARSITPTAAATDLADRARDALATLDALDEDVTALARGRAGSLRVGSFPTASEQLLPAALGTFLAAERDVTVHLDEAESDDLVRQLLDGRIDVALTYTYDLVPRTVPSTLVSHRLLDEALVLLLADGDELAAYERVRWNDLTDRTWVATRDGTAGAECLARLCGAAGFEPRIGFRSNDYDVVTQLVRSGLGVALVPSLAYAATPGVAARRIVGLAARRHVSAVVRRDRQNPAVTDFLAALVTAAAPHRSGIHG